MDTGAGEKPTVFNWGGTLFTFLRFPRADNAPPHLPPNNKPLYAYKSVDAGATWSVVDSGNEPQVMMTTDPLSLIGPSWPSQPSTINAILKPDGSTVLIPYAFDTGVADLDTGELRFVEFDMTSETWGTPVTGGPGVTGVDVSDCPVMWVDGQYCSDIGVYLFVYQSDHSPAQLPAPRSYYVTTSSWVTWDGVAWSAPQPLGDPITDTFNTLPRGLVYDTNTGNIHVFTVRTDWGSTAIQCQKLYHQRWTHSDGLMGAPQLIDTGTNPYGITNAGVAAYGPAVGGLVCAKPFLAPGGYLVFPYLKDQPVPDQLNEPWPQSMVLAAVAAVPVWTEYPVTADTDYWVTTGGLGIGGWGMCDNSGTLQGYWSNPTGPLGFTIQSADFDLGTFTWGAPAVVYTHPDDEFGDYLSVSPGSANLLASNRLGSQPLFPRSTLSFWQFGSPAPPTPAFPTIDLWTPAYSNADYGPFKVGGKFYHIGMGAWNGNAPAGYSGVDQTGLPSFVSMFFSNDNGGTWTELDGLNRPILVSVDSTVGGVDSYYCEARHFAGGVLGTKYWCVYWKSTGVNQGGLTVRWFDFITEQWEPESSLGPTVSFEVVPTITAGFIAIGACNLIVASVESTTGNIVVGYNEGVLIEYTGTFTTSQACVSIPKLTTYNVGTDLWSAPVVCPGVDTTPVQDGTTGATKFTYSWYSMTGGVGGRVHGFVTYWSQVIQPGGLQLLYPCHWLASNGAGVPGGSTQRMTDVLIDEAGTFNRPNSLIDANNNGSCGQAFTMGSNIGIMITLPDPGGVFRFYAMLQAASADSPVWSSTDLTPYWGTAPLYNDSSVPSCAYYDTTLSKLIIVSKSNDFDPFQGTQYLEWDDATKTFGGFTPIYAFTVEQFPYMSFGSAAAGSVELIVDDPTSLGYTVPGFYPHYYTTGGSPAGGITGLVTVPPPAVPVLTGGKVSLVGGMGGAPPPVTPGGWPVWPPVFRIANEYDRCLQGIKRWRECHPLKDASRCVDMVELWGGNDVPLGLVEFWKSFKIVTPGPGDTLVGEFRIPTGYRGMLYGIHLGYTGTGFEEGSGDIYWRVQIGNAWAAPGLGNVSTQLGVPGQCLQLTDYIKVKSNQLIRVWVNVPNGSGNIQVGTSRILATLQGWYYP
jgi:hypothetical protein